jgi:DNA polymerase III epsilon subunit-like protein
MIVTAFDTETTGLIINPARKLDTQPEIISIAIQTVNLQTAELSDPYYKIFRPVKPISEEISRITGFNNENLSGAPPIKDHLESIIMKLQNAPLLIGQNIRFDMSMVELECMRYNTGIKWPKSLDLVENTIHMKGYRLSLTNLHMELFGHDFDSAHRADIDVMITCKCAIELYKRGLL